MRASKPEIQKRTPPVPVPMVRTIRVKTGPQAVIIRGEGTVRPLREINLVPEVSGKVVYVSTALVGGGIFKPEEGPCPAKLSFYIDVDDLAPYRQKIVEAGGKILVEEQEVPGVGSFTLFQDPEARVLGLWKQNK